MLTVHCSNCGANRNTVKCGVCLEKFKETDTVFVEELKARLQGHWDQRPVHPADTDDAANAHRSDYERYDERVFDWLQELEILIEERLELE